MYLCLNFQEFLLKRKKLINFTRTAKQLVDFRIEKWDTLVKTRRPSRDLPAHARDFRKTNFGTGRLDETPTTFA